MPRTWANLLVILLFFVFIVLFFTSFIPPMLQQARSLASNSEAIVSAIQRLFSQEKLTIFGRVIYFDSTQLIDATISAVQTLLALLPQYLLQLTINTIYLITLITFVLMITFFFLQAEDHWINVLSNIIPLKTKKFLSGLAKEINSNMKDYIKGQLLLCLAVGVATWIGGLIIGLNNILLLAFIAGLLEAIPIFGPLISAVPAVFVALVQVNTPFGMTSFNYSLLVIFLFFLVQRLENNLLVPVILGRSVNLNPVIILFAISLGGYVGGILGMFLAVPIASIINITLRYIGSYKF